MDDFRKMQKKDCADGSQNKRSSYGCPCCRKIRDLAKHKRVSRRRSRHRLASAIAIAFEESWDRNREAYVYLGR
jgi:hypothetical protein